MTIAPEETLDAHEFRSLPHLGSKPPAGSAQSFSSTTRTRRPIFQRHSPVGQRSTLRGESSGYYQGSHSRASS